MFWLRFVPFGYTLELILHLKIRLMVSELYVSLQPLHRSNSSASIINRVQTVFSLARTKTCWILCYLSNTLFILALYILTQHETNEWVSPFWHTDVWKYKSTLQEYHCAQRQHGGKNCHKMWDICDSERMNPNRPDIPWKNNIRGFGMIDNGNLISAAALCTSWFWGKENIHPDTDTFPGCFNFSCFFKVVWDVMKFKSIWHRENQRFIHYLWYTHCATDPAVCSILVVCQNNLCWLVRLRLEGSKVSTFSTESLSSLHLHVNV